MKQVRPSLRPPGNRRSLSQVLRRLRLFRSQDRYLRAATQDGKPRRSLIWKSMEVNKNLKSRQWSPSSRLFTVRKRTQRCWSQIMWRGTPHKRRGISLLRPSTWRSLSRNKLKRRQLRKRLRGKKILPMA